MKPEKRIPRGRDGEPERPGRSEGPVRARRALEPWEIPFGVEPYPGATVLEDWDVTEHDEVGSIRVLSRYAVIRVLLLSEAGLLRGVKLRTEQRIASEHLRLLPSYDWERQALQRLNDQCGEHPSRALLDAINDAAEAAAKRGHVWGAFAFYRTAGHMALERAAWAEAARAARGLAYLAKMDEARHSTELWERRAGTLERRAAQERAAATDGPPAA